MYKIAECGHVKDDLKKLHIIFTHTSWEVGTENICPACKKSPVQLLFTEAISRTFSFGECLLCKQLVAYKGSIQIGKRSKIRQGRKNYVGGNPMDSRRIELLHFLESEIELQKKSKFNTRKKFRKKPNNDLQLDWIYDLCIVV